MTDPNDLWILPAIVSFDAMKVSYQNPLVRYINGIRVEYSEAVELFVETDAPLPERALSPALFVGSHQVLDYRFLGDNLYKFYEFDISTLVTDAAVSLGWPQTQKEATLTGLVFEIRGTVNS